MSGTDHLDIICGLFSYYSILFTNFFRVTYQLSRFPVYDLAYDNDNDNKRLLFILYLPDLRYLQLMKQLK